MNSIGYLASGPGDLLNGVKPSWGPFASVGNQARVLIGVLWAAALLVCVAITIWGASQQRLGSGTYNSAAAERGKALFSSGLVGCVILGSIPALTAIAYGLGIG
jgi:hypothetical protein